MQVLLAGPRGFCAGVSRAVEIVERVLEIYGPPVYVKHEIIHNHQVVADLRNRGAVFVESLDEVPPGQPADLLGPRRAALGPGARRSSAASR